MDEERFNRLEARFDHMEGMMSQLIAMVGKMREEQEVMKQELTDMKQEQAEMKRELTDLKQGQAEMKQNISSLKENYQDMRTENSHRHTEIMRKFNSINADQEFTWKKAVQNEREIAKLKGQFMGN